MTMQRGREQRQRGRAGAHDRRQRARIGTRKRAPALEAERQAPPHRPADALARSTAAPPAAADRARRTAPDPGNSPTLIELEPRRTRMHRVVREQPNQHELVIAIELRPDHDALEFRGIVQPLLVALQMRQHFVVKTSGRSSLS